MQDSRMLRAKTIRGIFWSFADLLASHGLQFVIQIGLARLLLPEHFGVMGMILVFIAISNSIVDSGFSQALIRDQTTSQADYSTVFYFNSAMAIAVYGVLYIIAPLVSTFYEEPQLVILLRVLSLALIINSLGIIQRVQLTKEVNFKKMTIINLIAVTLSGVITIGCAIEGYGVWSLVVNILVLQSTQTICLWLFNRWVPSFVFSSQSFVKYFGFGYKLMLSGLLDTLYTNLFFVLIGKIYSSSSLGYYTNAVKVRDLASQSLAVTIQRVTYPVLSTIQDDEKQLKASFRKIIKISAFVNFPLMIGLAAIATPLFTLLFGEKWIPSVIYFQLLCFAGMLYPIHAINLTILQVKGRSDLFLWLEIIKKVNLTLLIILSLAFQMGVIGLIIAAVVNSFTALLINTYYSAREIGYATIEQLLDLMPSFLISIVMGAFVYALSCQLRLSSLTEVVLLSAVGIVIYIILCKFMRLREFGELLSLIKPIFIKVKRRFRNVSNHK